ncbi:MAG TPA: OmpA family protein [Longimicrobium sp.]|jgi:flagellar motor protein MotB
MSFDQDESLEIGGPSGTDHGGPWPAFTDLFAATSMIMLVFFVVMAFGYVQASGKGPEVDRLYAELNSLADRQRTFSVEKVGVDVLVILEENVTFPRNRSGLVDLKPQGRAALHSIGQVTRDARLGRLIREIEVVGHADRTQYARRSALTNWGISTARAATVAEFMIDSVRLDPCSVIPSGRGEYFPRDTRQRVRNDSTDARDRRIELLLHPVIPGSSSGGRPGCRPK